MFQVNFSEQSMHELNQLDTRSQMLLVEVVSSLTQEQLDHPSDDLGRFHRNGKTFIVCVQVSFAFILNRRRCPARSLHFTPQYVCGFCFPLEVAGDGRFSRRAGRLFLEVSGFSAAKGRQGRVSTITYARTQSIDLSFREVHGFRRSQPHLFAAQ